MRSKQSLTSREISEMNHFDVMAQAYDTNYTYDVPFTQYKIQKKIKQLFASYDKNKVFSILEIGAGTGEYTQYLAELFPNAKITAIDISPKILAVAKKKCKRFKNVTFQVASAYDLPYKSKSFDIICGFYILHHLDLKATLKEMHRLLKPKAEALFYEPNLLNPVVLAIKSLPFLKKMVGDSPEEWAINSIQLEDTCQPFKSLKWETTEFVILPSSLALETAVRLDAFFSLLGRAPLLNLVGGSVCLRFKKG